MKITRRESLAGIVALLFCGLESKAEPRKLEEVRVKLFGAPVLGKIPILNRIMNVQGVLEDMVNEEGQVDRDALEYGTDFLQGKFEGSDLTPLYKEEFGERAVARFHRDYLQVSIALLKGMKVADYYTHRRIRSAMQRKTPHDMPGLLDFKAFRRNIDNNLHKIEQIYDGLSAVQSISAIKQAKIYAQVAEVVAGTFTATLPLQGYDDPEEIERMVQDVVISATSTLECLENLTLAAKYGAYHNLLYELEEAQDKFDETLNHMLKLQHVALAHAERVTGTGRKYDKMFVAGREMLVYDYIAREWNELGEGIKRQGLPESTGLELWVNYTKRRVENLN